MGGNSSDGSVRQATSPQHSVRSVTCYLCMSAPATEVVKGFTSMVNVCHFCYNALQGLNLEEQHDIGGVERIIP